MLGDRRDEVLLLLTSIWNDEHVSKYTNAFGKESMKCVWCEMDFDCAHSTQMVNHLKKARCAGILLCASISHNNTRIAIMNEKII